MYTLAGNSTYFEIYAFTIEKVGIVKELKNSNCLHVDHDLKKESFGKLCVWVKQEKTPFCVPVPEKAFIFRCTKNKENV